jgi:hypothetical protein
MSHKQLNNLMESRIPYVAAIMFRDRVSIYTGEATENNLGETLAKKYVLAMCANGFEIQEITKQKLDDFLKSNMNGKNYPIDIRYFYVVWTDYYPIIEDLNTAIEKLYGDQ